MKLLNGCSCGKKCIWGAGMMAELLDKIDGIMYYPILIIVMTLAQIYKRKNDDGECYGGPAYYIERALHAPVLAGIFCVFLIATYAVGFNLLCSYNLQSTFTAYEFYDAKITPIIIGAILAVLTAYCLLGGGKRIISLTSIIVPVMGVAYVIISLIVIFRNITRIPSMFAMIFEDAFNFKAIFGGMAGSCLIYGVKRGLYSNEAGVGSAPNASASAKVSHPAKQGLVQTLSVYIDTLLLCTATALMCLSSGVERNEAVSGAPYVQNAISTVFGKVGPTFITVAMILFAFTTLLGNLPACMLLGKIAIDTLKDYEKQKKAGVKPVFKAREIGLNEEELDFWKDSDD